MIYQKPAARAGESDAVRRRAVRRDGGQPGAGFRHGAGRLAGTAVMLAALPVAAAGCGTGSPASGPAQESAAASPARQAPAGPPSMTGAPQAAGPTSTSTYLAESQDARGTIVRAPACAHGCPVSGDGTIVLYDMTWPAWTGSQAVGRGTEAIESCDPSCAAGGQYKVAVDVTFSDPVKDCAAGKVMWLWTKATFTWPNGLPSALHGQAAPLNPWRFTALKSQLAASCA